MPFPSLAGFVRAKQPDAPEVPAEQALRFFLEARNEEEAQQQLDRIVQENAPVIRSIVRRKLRLSARPDADGTGVVEDLYGEAVLQFLTWLREFKQNPQRWTGANVRGLVAVTTYRVCDGYLRRQYPQRTSLKNKLTYLLTRQANSHGFALWDDPEGGRLCGFAAWRDAGHGQGNRRRCQEALARPQLFMEAALPGESANHVHPAALLAAFFHWVGGPVELDDLVQLVAALWGVQDQPVATVEPDGEGGLSAYDRAGDPFENRVATEVEQRAYLARLWEEIQQLPPRQGAALLLNLRDAQGRGVIALLPLLRIASPRQLALALDLPLERFAALWNELPIEDAAIADLLGVTRQQVINLRKVARERLVRRMRTSTEPA
jgi:hypothetical protein